MGRYLTPGHTFIDGQTVTGPSLTEHVSEASFETTAWTEQTLKDPAALTDQILIVASDAFFHTTIQQIHDLILYAGSIVQTQFGEYTANTNLATGFPIDDTFPQNTEGTEILSVSITPRFATSTILCQFYGGWGTVNADWGACALFRDSGVNAIAAQAAYNSTVGGGENFGLVHMDSPATTSLLTYKIRAGSISSIMRMNGTGLARQFGGASKATLVLQEIKA